MKLVEPLKDFGWLLNTVQAPSKYLGGEYGSVVKPHVENDSRLNVAVAFPDMYEIGMSNLAIKIIYNGLNAYDDIRSELVFAPDKDFEELLVKKNIPLYTLQTGMPLGNTDVVAFSIGYELCATEVLAMLDLGKIPLKVCDRGEDDPVVISGGCGTTNPEPMSDFFDAVMIGEAEEGLFALMEELAALKKSGASRKEKMELIASKPFMWTKKECSIYVEEESVDKSILSQNKSKKIARKAVQKEFGLVPSVTSYFPLPSIRPVQDHGVIEIMRGCPNGCRFCHAGVYYRPTRVKNLKLIIDEIDHLVFDAGYREVSLNSLSSADFPEIENLLDILNERYKGYNVSFQLPSLKVNSMSLPLLEKLSTVRKSGLTFAVETPEETWQLSLNKEVYAQHLETIIKEAKAKGWNSAKFYFMIGLPLGDYFGESGSDGTALKSEEETIVEFMTELQRRTRIQCNVNVGVFIPKPHTAYQWVKQLSPAEAARKVEYLYQNLPRGKFKLGRHNYDTTVLEGLLSRGDHRVGELILKAYNKGARFDAWDEHLRVNMQYWREAFEEADWDVMGYVYREWSVDEILPWDSVSLGPAKGFYKREWQRSIDHVLTPKCINSCDHPCGICSDKTGVHVFSREEIESVSAYAENKKIPVVPERPVSNIPLLYRVVFNFTRKNGGEYSAYLSQVEVFHKAILRSTMPFVFTTGFNPLPRLEFATAMSLGIPSYEETASCYLYDSVKSQEFIDNMNKVLPECYHIQSALVFPVTNLRKREPLSQNLWGGMYLYKFREGYRAEDFFNSSVASKFFQEEKKYTFAKYTSCEDFHRILTKNDMKDFMNNSIPNVFLAQTPVSDKVFRTAIEEFYEGKRWWEVVVVNKVRTLADPRIQGWTAKDEENWRYNNKSFEKDEIKTESELPVSYVDLFKKIAQINLELINKKQQLEKEREEFYREHPDVYKRHQENKLKAKESK